MEQHQFGGLLIGAGRGPRTPAAAPICAHSFEPCTVLAFQLMIKAIMIMRTGLEFQAPMVRYDGNVMWPVLSRWAFCSKRSCPEYARLSSTGCDDGLCIDVHGGAEIEGRRNQSQGGNV